MARTALKLTAAALALAAGNMAASAADYIPPPPVIEVPPEVHPVDHSGWYLRGDASVGGSYIGTVIVAPDRLDKAHTGITGGLGVGVGYQATHMFRMDATLNHRMFGKLRGSDSTSTSCAGGIGTCSAMSDAKFSSTEIMANAYFDLGNFRGLTPYVGGGLGAAYTKFGTYNVMQNCFSDAANAAHCYGGPAGFSQRTYTVPGNGEWNFAWNLQAGLAFDLTHNTKLDLGYKFTRVNDVKITNGATIAGVDFSHSTKHLDFHDARIGIRYNF